MIKKYFETLPFCHRWLQDIDRKNHEIVLNHLCEKRVLQSYPPLYDALGSYTAHFGHTVLLRPTCKEVVSRGVDY
jgi:methionyl aminopeptidase